MRLTNSTPPLTAIPTQTRYPWRATLRTVAVAALALLPILPDIARAADIDTIPFVVTFLSVTAAIQRVIAIPAFDRWLKDNFKSLSAAPTDSPESHHLDYVGKHRKSTNEPESYDYRGY